MGAILARYRGLAPTADLERIAKLAPRLKGYTIQHVHSTSLEGGLVDMLERSAPLYGDLGLHPRFNLMVGTEEYFDVCSLMQQGLTGTATALTPAMLSVFLDHAKRNVKDIYLSADAVITHDLQALPLVGERGRGTSWIWRCHFDLSRALPEPWKLLRRFLHKYDATIFSHSRFARKTPCQTAFLRPAIDPFSERNRELPPHSIREAASRWGLDLDVPMILQVANYDQVREWPGLLKLFRRLRREVDCSLVLAHTATRSHRGNQATLDQVRDFAENQSDIHVVELHPGAFREVNVLEQAATAVLQPSTHQGFDLIVLESLWNRKPVIVGSASGRLMGIAHGQSGYLMSSLTDAYGYLKALLSDPALRERIARTGRDHVRANFLITRVIKEYLELFTTLEGR